MNLNKHLEFFDPLKVKEGVHIIGIGAIGSRIAEQLVRLGIEELHVYDFDTVEAHNITNQLYDTGDLGNAKVCAFHNHAKMINPDVKIHQHIKGYNINMPLSGYVFLAVDSIDLRREIATAHKYNPNVIAMFDVRMRLEDSQCYAANWKDESSKKVFINSMQFTHEEAKEATPISACGTTLSVAPLVLTTASLTVANFINFIRTGELTQMILPNVFKNTLVTY